MKAIILAAGKGSRLYPITLNKPKGLLEIGDETILDRLIRQFRGVGIKDIVIVVGYQKEKIIKHFKGSVRFLQYSNYDKTNNLHTLWSVRDELNDDVIITFSSVEHSGLGRYGDPLNPDGDIETMNSIYNNLKKDGLLIWGAPVCEKDGLVWNKHRIYGPKRLLLLFK